jgi:hypothetical protein
MKGGHRLIFVGQSKTQIIRHFSGETKQASTGIA